MKIYLINLTPSEEFKTECESLEIRLKTLTEHKSYYSQPSEIVIESTKESIKLYSPQQNHTISLDREKWEAELLKWLPLLLSQESSFRESTKKIHLKTQELIEQLESQVEIATHIQKTIHKKNYQHIPGVKVAAKYIPASGPGGDYHDIFEIENNTKIGIILADSETYGMAASLLSVLLKLKIDEVKNNFPSSGSLVKQLNKELLSLTDEPSHGVSLLYAVINRKDLSLDMTCAGNIFSHLWRNGQPVEIPLPNHPPLGLFESDFQSTQALLKPSDWLGLYSDGLTKGLQLDPKGTKELFTQTLSQANHTPDIYDVENTLISQLQRQNTPPKGDMTLLQLTIDQNLIYVAR